MNHEPYDEDAKWLRSVVDRHAEALVRYAASITRDADGARDIVQETFFRLWNSERSEVEPRLQAWLFRVCRNRALDVRRKGARVSSLDGGTEAPQVQAPEESPAAAAEQRDSQTQILQLVESLPENQREVVLLKFRHDLSYREIAEITALSVTNIGFLLHTALKTLRGRAAAIRE